MIEQILKQLEPRVMCMPFIERFGGLVRIARKTFINNIGMSYEKVYPVSSTIRETDCWDKGLYTDLMPNEKYKSVSYFEQISPVIITNSDLGSNYFKAETNVKFVCWINLKKLGIERPDTQAFEYSFFKEFFGGSTALMGNYEFATRVNIKPTKVGSKSENPFAGYSYEDKAALLMYPFDFFHIDLNITWHMNPKCYDHPSIYPEIC